MKFLLSLIPISILLTGCATQEVVQAGGSQQISLSPERTVYVAVPEDGQYGSTVYHGSGEKAAGIIQTNFGRHASRVISAREPKSFEDALTAALDRGADYLVFPTIIHWEDRATEWSGIPYKAEVKIEVVDVASEQTLQAVIIKGESSVMSTGGQPEDLLPDPVERFVDAAY